MCLHIAYVRTMHMRAGAVQDLDAGVIVGLGPGRTYGKGLVQSIKVRFMQFELFILALHTLTYLLCVVSMSTARIVMKHAAGVRVQAYYVRYDTGAPVQ
jgi:hypothetical protein